MKIKNKQFQYLPYITELENFHGTLSQLRDAIDILIGKYGSTATVNFDGGCEEIFLVIN